MAYEGPLVDRRLAREARAADQCMRLGAVVLRRGRSRAGFAAGAERPTAPAELARSSSSSSGSWYRIADGC